jgi:K+ transporter
MNPTDASHPTPTRVLALSALGVVFGDIGTSPLYAFKESLHHVAMDGTAASNSIAAARIS